MSRSGYSDDGVDDLTFGRWRGRVTSATRGKRGQALLKAAAAALDAMEDKRLARYNLSETNGCRCVLGVVLAQRGLDDTARQLDAEYDPYFDDDPSEYLAELAAALDVAEPLIGEIMYENDYGGCFGETPVRRWQRMRAWVESRIDKAGSGK